MSFSAVSVSERSCGRSSGRYRRADHKIQGVLVLGHQGRVAGDIDPRRIDAGLGLVEVEGGGDPGLEAALDEAVVILLVRQGILGKLQPLLVRGEAQIGGGDLGYQAYLDAAPGLFRGEVLVQRLVLEAPYPAEKVKLVGAEAKADA